MKYVIFLISLSISLFSCAQEDIQRNTSFYELTSSDHKLDSKLLSLRGFLMQDDDGIYFCINMEVCLSRGKERLIVQVENGELINYLRTVSNCHMELVGRFKNLGLEQKSWPLLGFIKVSKNPEFDFNERYFTINPNCKAYNAMYGTTE